MPAVNGVGEPCAGEPHARFEAAGTGNGADLAKDTGVAQPTGKPAATKAPGPKASEPPRQSPTLQEDYLKVLSLIAAPAHAQSSSNRLSTLRRACRGNGFSIR